LLLKVVPEKTFLKSKKPKKNLYLDWVCPKVPYKNILPHAKEKLDQNTQKVDKKIERKAFQN